MCQFIYSFIFSFLSEIFEMKSQLHKVVEKRRRKLEEIEEEV